MEKYRTLGEFELAETLAVEKLLNDEQLNHYILYVDLATQYREIHGEPQTTQEFQQEREYILSQNPDIEPTMAILGRQMLRILNAGTDGAMTPAFFM